MKFRIATEEELQNNEWKDISEYPERYAISRSGLLLSKAFIKYGKNVNGVFSYTRKNYILTFCKNEDGYLQTAISTKAGRTTVAQHRLLADAFIPNPKNKPHVNHINSIRDDNRIENLEWVTAQENSQHGFDFGFRSSLGEKHPRSVLTNSIVIEIRRLKDGGFNCKQIADKLGLKYCTVWSAARGKNWGHIDGK